VGAGGRTTRGQRHRLAAAAWHDEVAMRPVPLLVRGPGHRGGGGIALPGLCGLGQPIAEGRVTAMTGRSSRETSKKAWNRDPAGGTEPHTLNRPLQDSVILLQCRWNAPACSAGSTASPGFASGVTDLFGCEGWCWRVIRTSIAYGFRDRRKCRAGRHFLPSLKIRGASRTKTF
jgi:hypothetical protein